MSASERELGAWTIETPDTGDSQIRVGRNICSWAVATPPGCGRVAILTQPSVNRLAANLAARISLPVDLRELPDADAAKTLDVVGAVYEWLNSIRFGRGDRIVAVGGGSLTDVAGFIAATYMRGVDVAYVPTTLLGAVDASIGGKTGINVEGKNLVGSFRHPRRVAVDLDILDALPKDLLRDGAAEAAKAGFIADPAIITAYETRGLDASLEDIVPAAISVKVKTVTADFRESGIRATLNYGHTIGHAIEIAAKLPHGHAVAIGMAAAGKVSERRLGFAGVARQRRVIEKLGLPTRAPAVEGNAVWRLLERDKKRDRDGVRMVLLEDFGKPVLRHVSDGELRLGFEEIGVAVD
jgi:3-dehydroquinate synthase